MQRKNINDLEVTDEMLAELKSECEDCTDSESAEESVGIN